MHESIVEVGRVAEREGIDADYARGGTISLARNEAQLARARELVEEERRLTGPVEGLELLSKEEAEDIARATRVLGATYTPHCAVVHPLKLVRGLAERVEARGVSLFERTRATGLRRGELVTDHGSVRADVVVRATEGYTAEPARRAAAVRAAVLADDRHRAAPAVGLGRDRPAPPRDVRRPPAHAHLRPAHRRRPVRVRRPRRAVPLRLARRGRTSTATSACTRCCARCSSTSSRRSPAYEVTHRWGGALGVPRDWHASVGFDRAAGLAWAGGYVGDGVATANLAGRTLAQLITGRESDLTHLPWVGHRSRDWEPEPLRWLGRERRPPAPDLRGPRGGAVRQAGAKREGLRAAHRLLTPALCRPTGTWNTLRVADSELIEQAAEDLYGLPPGEFTRARDARAKELRTGGERDAANAVKALRKPTVAAWALNQLTRRRKKDLAALLSAGEQPARGSGGAARRRRPLRRSRTRPPRSARWWRSWRADATAMATEAGERSGGLQEKVAETLHAAALDEETAEELRAGPPREGARGDRRLRRDGRRTAGQGPRRRAFQEDGPQTKSSAKQVRRGSRSPTGRR